MDGVVLAIASSPLSTLPPPVTTRASRTRKTNPSLKIRRRFIVGVIKSFKPSDRAIYILVPRSRVICIPKLEVSGYKGRAIKPKTDYTVPPAKWEKTEGTRRASRPCRLQA